LNLGAGSSPESWITGGSPDNAQVGRDQEPAPAVEEGKSLQLRSGRPETCRKAQRNGIGRDQVPVTPYQPREHGRVKAISAAHARHVTSPRPVIRRGMPPIDEPIGESPHRDHSVFDRDVYHFARRSFAQGLVHPDRVGPQRSADAHDARGPHAYSTRGSTTAYKKSMTAFPRMYTRPVAKTAASTTG